MHLATLRVAGPHDTLTSLRKSLDLAIDAEWSQGDLRRNGHPHDSSGFNATIAETNSSAELLHQIRAFLHTCGTLEIRFSTPELQSELDVALMVGSDDQFTSGIALTPDDLSQFASLGLTLRITA